MLSAIAQSIPLPSAAIMTSAEADQLIVLSRHSLKRFRQLAAAGHRATAANLPLIEKELSVLNHIAHNYPDKVSKFLGLVGEWLELRDSIRVTLH